MNIFKINFDRLIKLLLPVSLRYRFNVIFLHVILSPIKTLYKSLLNYRDDNLYKLGINSQVCYLEKNLNDRFDKELRRIQINDPVNNVELLYVYLDVEEKPIYLDGDNYIFQSDEIIQNTKADFIVSIPIEIDVNISIVEANINAYKLPTKKFEIKRI